MTFPVSEFPRTNLARPDQAASPDGNSKDGRIHTSTVFLLYCLLLSRRFLLLRLGHVTSEQLTLPIASFWFNGEDQHFP